MTHTECWVDIPGWLGLYQVSDQGRVRSLDRRVSTLYGSRLVKGRMLRGTQCRGYRYVSNGRERKGIHQLVLRAFVGPPPLGQVVRHLDGDPKNNRLENLAYGTPSENTQDLIRHGRHNELRKTHCPHGHTYADENLYLDRRGRRFCRACFRRRSREYRRRRQTLRGSS